MRAPAARLAVGAKRRIGTLAHVNESPQFSVCIDEHSTALFSRALDAPALCRPLMTPVLMCHHWASTELACLRWSGQHTCGPTTGPPGTMPLSANLYLLLASFLRCS